MDIKKKILNLKAFSKFKAATGDAEPKSAATLQTTEISKRTKLLIATAVGGFLVAGILFYMISKTPVDTSVLGSTHNKSKGLFSNMFNLLSWPVALFSAILGGYAVTELWKTIRQQSDPKYFRKNSKRSKS